MPERDWLVYFKIGLIIAIAGSLLGIVVVIYWLGSVVWVLGVAHRYAPEHARIEITIPMIIPAYVICLLLLDIIVLIFSVSLYGGWSQIKTKEHAERIYSQLIILIIITVLAMNIIALIGAVIAIYGILSGFPGLKFRLSISRPPKEITPKATIISPGEAYERLFATYQRIYGIGLANKLLKMKLKN